MDVLRAALGDNKLTYYGASYGTYLGAFYAEQFPKNIRALVLDGAVDPQLSSTELLIEQAKGFETALRAFADDCVRSGGCPFGTTADTVIANIASFLAATDKKPLSSTRNSRKVTESLAVMGIARALYVKEYWPVLRQSLIQAMQKGDGTYLLALADEMVERKEDGSYSNQTDANMAVNCVDKPNPPDLATYGKSAEEAKRVAPDSAPSSSGAACPVSTGPSRSSNSRSPSPPRAQPRSSSSEPSATPQRRTSGPRVLPTSSPAASCSPSTATATPPTCRATPASTRPPTSTWSRPTRPRTEPPAAD